MGVLFSAVGIIEGHVEEAEDNKLVITIADKKYPLLWTASYKDAIYALRKELSRSGGQLKKMIVYPKIIHFPDRNKPHVLQFQVVGFDGSSSAKNLLEELQPWEFKLFGLWQFIAPCRTPVISVFKNLTDERLAKFKELEPGRKVKYAKASHLPLLWKDALVPPFRFNPRDKEQKKEIYFVGVKAKFNPDRDVFEFDSLLSPPTLEHPSHFRYKIKQEKKTPTKGKKGYKGYMGKPKPKGQPKSQPKGKPKPKQDKASSQPAA